jgi:multimeric flavodoxin WrbA
MKCLEKRNGRCIIEGDVVNEYLEKMYAADAIILGSPTYFADVTAELKTLIDRAGFVALANGGAFSGKIGAAVVAVRRVGVPMSSTPSITCSLFVHDRSRLLILEPGYGALQRGGAW